MEFPQKLHRGYDINFFYQLVNSDQPILVWTQDNSHQRQLRPLVRQLTPPYGQLGPLFKDNSDQYLV